MGKRGKVVARFRDGRTVKGYMLGFIPDKNVFHVVAPEPDDQRVEAVSISDLKAIFFVKSFHGDRHRVKSNQLAKQALRKIVNLKVKVTFPDAEVLYGTTSRYSKKKNFFLAPTDTSNNNDMVYVVGDSTLSVASWI